MKEKIFETKNWQGQSVKVMLVRDMYRKAFGDGIAIFLVAAEDCPEADMCLGEAWSSVTVNLEGLRPGEIAIDNDLATDPSLTDKVVRYLCSTPEGEDPEPVRYIPSGFCMFPVYRVSREVVESIPTYDQVFSQNFKFG